MGMKAFPLICVAMSRAGMLSGFVVLVAFIAPGPVATI